MKWIYNLFAVDEIKTVYILMLLQNLSIIMGSSRLPLLPFFDKSKKSHNMNEFPLIMPIIFKAFDHLLIDFNYEEVDIKILLQLPVHQLLQTTEGENWLTKYSHIKGHHQIRYK